MSEEIRIYVACLAAYNNGKLHGVWIDATDDIDDIQDQINEMLESSPEEDAEEWAIHDYEGYGSYRLSEYEGIQSAHEIACFIEAHGEIAAELLSHFSTIDEAKKSMEENYAGCHESVADFAEELTTDTTEIPESVRRQLGWPVDDNYLGRLGVTIGTLFPMWRARCQVNTSPTDKRSCICSIVNKVQTKKRLRLKPVFRRAADEESKAL